jgi:sulfopyruvate decarboxylase subunit alpha
MKGDTAKAMVKEMKAAGISIVVSLPDTGVGDIYSLTKDDPDLQLIPATNEGEGVCIAAGAWLAGKKTIMVMENSGLRVSCEALSQLSMNHSIPVLLLMSYRGDIGDGNWFMTSHGVVTEPLLKTLRIPYRIINKEEEIDGVLQQALRTMNASQNHVAVLVGGGLIW